MPQVKSDNGKALAAYAMILIGCCNSVEDIKFLEEMDNPTNLRTVISKLPYKMKEQWRMEAFELKERRGRRARFAELVNPAEKIDHKQRQPMKKDIHGSSFATFAMLLQKAR